jgi:hypothetical protein
MERLNELFPASVCEKLIEIGLVIPSLNGTGKWQANAVNGLVLADRAKTSGYEEHLSHLEVLLEPSTLMDKEQVIAAMSAKFPEISMLFHLWDGSMLSRMRLTPVGTAIAHANLRRVSGETSDLSTWIK